MALPFLNKKKDAGIAGTIMQQRSPDEPDASEPEDQEYSLEDISQDILDAIHSNDAKALAMAIREAVLKASDSSEDKEDKPSPHSFESQNIKAAE